MAVVRSCSAMLGLVPQRAQPLLSVGTIKLSTHAILPAMSRRKVGMTSSHHAPYTLGYTRATKGSTESGEPVK